MFRTQVYLPEELRQEINILAKKEKKPSAQVVRELLSAGIEAKQGSIGDALTKLANIKSKGPADLSSRIDKYLYE